MLLLEEKGRQRKRFKDIQRTEGKLRDIKLNLDFISNMFEDICT